MSSKILLRCLAAPVGFGNQRVNISSAQKVFDLLRNFRNFRNFRLRSEIHPALEQVENLMHPKDELICSKQVRAASLLNQLHNPFVAEHLRVL